MGFAYMMDTVNGGDGSKRGSVKCCKPCYGILGRLDKRAFFVVYYLRLQTDIPSESKRVQI